MNELIHINEPVLTFGFEQMVEDPRDGLSLFGPHLSASPYGINYCVVGTEIGIQRFYRWLKNVKHFLGHPEVSKRNLWIPFPGFEEIFRVPLSQKAIYEKKINPDLIKEILTQEGDGFQRVYKIVNLYENQIAELDRNSDENISIWFVISPESVFHDCRPKSVIENIALRVRGYEIKRRQQKAKAMQAGQEFIFEDQEKDYYAYEFDNDFRRQLKARRILNNAKAPIQILRESTLTPDDFLDKRGARERDLQPESQVAWNLLSTAYYKAGGKPWKLSGVRDGVCYLGLVFKKLNDLQDKKSSCCAAQMFLDSGDGAVFRGAVGPWKSDDYEEYHINKEAAEEIINKAVQVYQDLNETGKKPKEIFIHGRAYLSDEEWEGFTSVCPQGIKVIGVRIRRSKLRVFRPGRFPVLRGTAYLETDMKGFLWTTGFIPRLHTNPYQGFPQPLCIEICRGQENIQTVLEDVFALTKLNYNSCSYGDGEPITLKFADMIGDILTAGPIEKDKAPLSFKYYI